MFRVIDTTDSTGGNLSQAWTTYRCANPALKDEVCALPILITTLLRAQLSPLLHSWLGR